MQDEESIETYTSMISEFILIGLDTPASARRLLTEVTYRGEILLSLPSGWAYNSEFLNRLYAFGFEIPDKKKEPYYFSSMINNMSSSVSYIHCFVVYEEITELIRQAMETPLICEEMDLSTHLKETALDKQHDPEQFYITEPTEINKSQGKFFYPTVLAFKTDGVYHNAFRSLLENLYEVLKGSEETLTSGFKKQEDLHLYRLMRFTANLFFLLNDFIRPSTGTIVNFLSINKGFPSINTFFHEKSALSLPYSEETLLLSVLELEIETLIFLWKSLILGENILVLSESDVKRFNIMEALSFLIFPFSSPPIKIPNFSMRIDSDASKMIIMAGKVFLGLSSKHVDLTSLIEEPFLKENYHIVDLDTSLYYPPKASQKPSMNLSIFEENLEIRLKSLRAEYLNALMEISFKNKADVKTDVTRAQKTACSKIHEAFFRFFEEEEQFMRVEKKYLNLKKVKYLRQHKFILKETNKLIEGFNKPQEFVKEMIYEYTFLNFAAELPAWGLSPSFRYKALMCANECKKLKLPIINPLLNLVFQVKDEQVLWFFEKLMNLADKNQWGNAYKENIGDFMQRFVAVLKAQTSSAGVDFSERTGITAGSFTFLEFFKKIAGRLVLFPEKFEEKDEEFLLKQLKQDVNLLNFEEIVLEDFKRLEVCGTGKLINISDDPSLELTKHLFLGYKALYLQHISQRNRNEGSFRKQIFDVLFESYRNYREFEKNFLAATLESKRPLDFPDFPRGLFHKLLRNCPELKDNKEKLAEIKGFIELMKGISPNSNLMTLMSNRVIFLEMQPGFSDLVSSFPLICYNYVNFLKKSFRAHDFLTLLNTPCRYKIRELAKKRQISRTLAKIKQEYRVDVKNLEEVFVQLSDLSSVHQKDYQDNEKLVFFINFFNLKLLHHLLFHHLCEESQEFPASPYHWLDFCEKLRFKLFGVDFSLLDMDISVIRQNLCIQQIFVPKLDFLTQLLSNEEHHLFKKKDISKEFAFFHRKKINEERLVNFTFFYGIRDTPIYRIFDEPQEISASLVEHTKEFFQIFKKFNNFQFFQKEKEIAVPIPKEVFLTYEEDFGLSKEKKIKFLGHYYDERLKNVSSSKIRLDFIAAKWDEFYLCPNYFS